MDTITSRQNQTFKFLKNIVSDKKARYEEKRFWVDGASFVDSAIKNGFDIKKLVYVQDEINTKFKEDILDSVDQAKWFSVNSDLYSFFSTKDNIQGIGALVEMKFQENVLLDGFGVVLENISDPGNLGTIIRTMTAFGVSNLYIVRPAVDPYHQSAIRASMGAIFNVNIVFIDDVEVLNSEKFTKIGTLLSPKVKMLQDFKKDFSSTDNTLLFFGTEKTGLSEKTQALIDEEIMIKISDKVDSLNVAESVGIFLYELVK